MHLFYFLPCLLLLLIPLLLLLLLFHLLLFLLFYLILLLILFLLLFPLGQCQAAREEWASTLWANLDIVKLTSGIDEFMRHLRKLPKEVKALGICNVLEEKMREFKDSIPLFADLKNDALRDRWATKCICT